MLENTPLLNSLTVATNSPNAVKLPMARFLRFDSHGRLHEVAFMPIQNNELGSLATAPPEADLMVTHQSTTPFYIGGEVYPPEQIEQVSDDSVRSYVNEMDPVDQPVTVLKCRSGLCWVYVCRGINAYHIPVRDDGELLWDQLRHL